MLAATSMIVMASMRQWGRTMARVIPIAANLGGDRHRNRLARFPRQTPDEERRLVYRPTNIGLQPTHSFQDVRPLPHKNCGWGAGALVTRGSINIGFVA